MCFVLSTHGLIRIYNELITGAFRQLLIVIADSNVKQYTVDSVHRTGWQTLHANINSYVSRL